MHGGARLAIAIALITTLASAFWSYREQAAAETFQFAPAIASRVWLPAAMPIKAIITNGIPSSAGVGDGITAVVSKAVVCAGRICIPAGAQLQGKLEKVTAFGERIRVIISFTTLTTAGRSVAIQTWPVMALVRVQSDGAILGAAVKMVIGAGIGAGVGAASGGDRLIEDFLLDGARGSLSPESTVPIIVILVRDLEI